MPIRPDREIVRPDDGLVIPIFYGWGMALSRARGHYIPHGAPVWIHHDGRPVGYGIDRWPGYVDYDGHLAVAEELVYRCGVCRRRLEGTCPECHGARGHTRQDIIGPGQVNTYLEPCRTCHGTGQLPPVPGYTAP